MMPLIIIAIKINWAMLCLDSFVGYFHSTLEKYLWICLHAYIRHLVKWKGLHHSIYLLIYLFLSYIVFSFFLNVDKILAFCGSKQPSLAVPCAEQKFLLDFIKKLQTSGREIGVNFNQTSHG